MRVNGRVKIRGRGTGCYGALSRSGARGLDAASEAAVLHCARSPSSEIFMRSIIVGGLVLLAPILTSCADPTSPTPQPAHDAAVLAAFARHRPTVPFLVPDSVGIPPSIPPIFEEVPAELDGTQ